MAVVNRDVTFDEDLFASSSSTKFEYEFVPGRYVILPAVVVDDFGLG